MAELNGPWGLGANDALTSDAQLYQEGWRELFGGILPEGVVGDPTGQALRVTATGTNTSITVTPGRAVVQGFRYSATTPVSLDLSTAGAAVPGAGQQRVDRIVLRHTPTAVPATRRLVAAVVAGSPSVAPAIPPLTRTPGGVWEMEIARIQWGPGAVTQANITQLQPRALVGWAIPAPQPPQGPVFGQMALRTDGGLYVFDGSWRWLGGGPGAVAAGVTPSDRTITTSGASICLNFNTTAAGRPAADGWPGLVSVGSTGSGNIRLVAEAAGRYRYEAKISVRNLATAPTADANIIASVRKNAGEVIGTGDELDKDIVTAKAAVNVASYDSLHLSWVGTLAQGEYLNTFINTFWNVNGTQVTVLGGQGRMSLEYLGR